MKKMLLLAVCLGFVIFSCSRPAPTTISLAGDWTIKLDRENVGVAERWYADTFSDPVKLPGILQAQGYGDTPNLRTPWIGGSGVEKFSQPQYAKYAKYITDADYKHPFWLTPDKYYRGLAWYQKEIDIPKAWEGQYIALHLERCHWETMVFLDDRQVGADSSLVAPHVYDLTPFVSAGKHVLTIRVNNDLVLNVGPNSHSVSDHTQSNWNGIVGDMSLRARPPVYIDNVKIFPDVAAKIAQVRVRFKSINGEKVAGAVTLAASLPKSLPALRQEMTIAPGEDFEFDYPMGENVELWDEFTPRVYTMRVTVESGGQEDVRDVDFGMREFNPNGTRFAINNRPVFLRGTLDCCVFPKTGYPPTDPAEWQKIYQTLKEHGLNHMRFHSWCPPEAAFVAADRVGFYLHVEGPSWANFGVGLGDGAPIDQFIYAETQRLLDEYGNHPSFCMYAYGNEPAGARQNEFLGAFVKHWQETDPRRVYTSAAGWPIILENDYHVTPAPRIQQWEQRLASVINAEPPRTDYDWGDFISSQAVPVVGHEIGQWCVYPNFAEMPKYTGYLKPKNFEIFSDLLQQNHIADQADDFFMASGELQAICYKAEVEAALRTPGYAGFQLLDIHDFPGQGTALIGILDPFYESKPYISAGEFNRFCGQTVPLARLAQLTLKNSDTFRAELEVAHFGQQPVENAHITWAIRGADGTMVKQGEFTQNLVVDNCQKIGAVEMPLGELASPQKLNLEVAVEGHGQNAWDFWVYPDEVALDESGILVADALNDDVLDKLKNGATVLLNLNGKIRQGKGAEVAIGFSSIFWNTAWTDDQAPHTLGILCNPTNPLFAEFPTEFHSNWQWWDIVHSSQAMILDDFPGEVRPLIQPIDTWFYARRLGLLFEGKVGQGKIVVTSIDFKNDLESRLAARQLYASLLNYMHSDKFAPQVEVEAEKIADLYR